jgi:hypothetical protein
MLIFLLEAFVEQTLGAVCVIGSILCIMYFEPWQMKFVSMIVLNIVVFSLSGVYDRLREKKRNKRNSNK